MKNTSKIALAAAIAIFASLAAIPKIKEYRSRGNAVWGLNQLSQLQLLIQAQIVDQESGKHERTQPAPTSLDELVENGYIPGGALKRMRDRFDIQYTPPPTIDSYEFRILEIRQDGFYIWKDLGGEGSIERIQS